MSDNTIHLLAELLALVPEASDPDLVLAMACEQLRDQQTEHWSRCNADAINA